MNYVSGVSKQNQRSAWIRDAAKKLILNGSWGEVLAIKKKKVFLGLFLYFAEKIPTAIKLEGRGGGG